ncbi:MAG: nucleotidyltransferase family protein [Bacteroidales bacterium]|nr:nucleotidyltransferase family protein [Bacteroidales bacterium]MCF8457068.1 nucleotidyltransferase family protein [Bacteroidales bacterium]
MEGLKVIKDKLNQEKEWLYKQYHVKYLAIFGSVSRGESTDLSDIDILVAFEKPVGLEFINLADDLEKLLHRKVDLVSENGIKPKYYDQIKNELIYV